MRYFASFERPSGLEIIRMSDYTRAGTKENAEEERCPTVLIAGDNVDFRSMLKLLP